jgi:hypothetical protein
VTLCRVLKVRRSGYYAWLERDESNRAKDDRVLAVEVAAVFAEKKKRYGSPRVHRELRTRGRRVCRRSRRTADARTATAGTCSSEVRADDALEPGTADATQRPRPRLHRHGA